MQLQSARDVTGAWDPSLLIVLDAAVVLGAATYRWVLAKPAPQLDDRFHLPEFTQIDARLISGVFGGHGGVV